MSYEAKLEAVRTIITQHNTHCDEKSKIDVEQFFQRLKASGGTTDEALKLCSWEDIEALTIPRLLARQIGAAFRKEEKVDRPQVITEKRAALLNTRELVEAFDPKVADSPVGQRLTKLSQGHPCIVFKDDGTLNVAATVECLEDIQQGYEARTVYIQDGVPTRVLRVGQIIETTVNENPLFAGHPLRGADDMCHHTLRPWKKVPHKARVMLRLATQSKELVVNQVGVVHDILDKFVDKKDDEIVKWIMTRYPQAAINYTSMELTGNLPTLKIVRGAAKPKQDPFFGNRTY